jgi:hypothetical protein
VQLGCFTDILTLVKPHERHRVSDVFGVNLEDKVNVLNSHSKKNQKITVVPVVPSSSVRCVRQFISHELQTASGSSASSPSSWPLKPFTSQAVESENEVLGWKTQEPVEIPLETAPGAEWNGKSMKIGAAE